MVVTVVFNHGKTVRGGRYLIVIDSGTGDNGIQNIAGDALDGNFYGTFPSGDGLPGGNFAASIATYHHNIVLAPVPVLDGYVSPGSAVIDPPAPNIATKAIINRSTTAMIRLSQRAQQAEKHDLAIEALTIDKKEKRHRA